MSAYGLIGVMQAVEGRGDELAEAMGAVAAGMGDVDGCDLYLVSRIEGAPDEISIVELWRDEAAHDASLQLPGTAEAIARIRPLIAGFSERRTLQPVAGRPQGD